MIRHRRSLTDYMNRLLSEGRAVFTAEEAELTLGVRHRAFLDAAERLQRRGMLLQPRRGFYVIVPPQFAAWGAPPPAWYIDALMAREDEPYYVGLLKAAELHGATHQAVMEFQVVCGKRLPEIRTGRNRVTFYFRRDMTALAPGVEDHKTDTGTMEVSSAELTALDLLRYPQASGGIDGVATVLSDLGGNIRPERLALLSMAFERPVVQRLGHLLEHVGREDLAGPMREGLLSQGALRWTELDPLGARDLNFVPNPRVRDSKWKVVARRLPEPDL